MNEEHCKNLEIPEIPKPITPKRSTIEIWPGRRSKSKPVPLEGPSHPIPNTGDKPPRHNPQPSAPAPAPPSPPAPPAAEPTVNSLPSVDEISSYWSFRNNSQFGIAVSKAGLEQYAIEIKRQFPTGISDKKALEISDKKALEIAEYFVVHHQVHHFLVDRAAATLEAVLERELWVPKQLIFSNSVLGYSPLEESLSCAYALRQIKDPIFVRHCGVLLALQPDGYKHCGSDGTTIKTLGGNVTHQQALGTLLSGYAQRTDTPQHRILGLHGLMLFKSHLDGTDGDLYYSVGGKKEKIEVHYSR